jgi:hypothetical protein
MAKWQWGEMAKGKMTKGKMGKGEMAKGEVGKGEMGINRPQHVRQIRGCFAHSA